LTATDIAPVPGGGFVIAATRAIRSTPTTSSPCGSGRPASSRLRTRGPAWRPGTAATWSGIGKGHLVQQGGKLLTLNQAGLAWNWRRFLPDGNPDPAFGVGGRRALADTWNGPNVQVLTQSDGRIVVARQERGPGSPT
jgi:hypothetical protein